MLQDDSTLAGDPGLIKLAERTTIARMNRHEKTRLLLWVFVATLAIVGVGCGSEQPAATSESTDTGEAAAAPQAAEARTTEGGIPLITGAVLIERIDAGDAPVILDVRTAAEYAEGHVPGAINISHDELAERLAEIESARDVELVVYCRSGRRAGIAEALLTEQGFTNLEHLEGDMLGWAAAERPTGKPKQ